MPTMLEVPSLGAPNEVFLTCWGKLQSRHSWPLPACAHFLGQGGFEVKLSLLRVVVSGDHSARP